MDDADAVRAMETVYANRRRSRTGRPVPAPFVLASFHVTVLVTLAVGGLHLSGALGDILGGLSTLVGLGFFAYLWGVTWWTNRRVLQRAPLADATTAPGARALVLAGTGWGGVTGLVVVVLPLAGLAVAFSTGGEVLSALRVLALGGLGGTTIGAIVGLVAAVVDIGLVRLVARIDPAR